ncbi:MAG: hypothetical protein MI923_15545 [Phycisphaerales bacterium]|nr:hypothetical protein [Phycisphaerales bacterium]
MNALKNRAGLNFCKYSFGAGILWLAIVSSSYGGAAQSIQFRKVAETGMAAPGTEPGVVFGALTTGLNHNLLIPKIDEAGRVAFMAMLSGPGIDVSNFQGMWAEENGMLRLVARGGLPAPGTEKGVNFIGVPSLELPFPPEGGGSHIAFHAELTGDGLDVTNDQGFWAGGPGSVRLVAREGGPAPGLPGLRFSIPFGVANEAGHVLLRSDLSGPGVNNTNNSSFFTDRSGVLESFLREGDAAPSTEAGTVFGGNFPFRAFSFNDNSSVAVSAKVEGPAVNGSNDQLLYVERDGTLDLVLREGEPAPGAGPGATFGGNSGDWSLDFVGLNNNERVAFLVRLGGALSTQTAIYSDHTGVLAPVALFGQPAPGLDFDFTLFATPVLNDSNQIVFGAAFPHDGGIFTPAPFGVFSDMSGSIAPVVSPGDTTLEGEVIDDARISGFNSAGQILLSVRIDSPAPRTGFWLRDTDGLLHRIAAIGDQFDVSGDGRDVRDVVRVVSGGMNEAGQVAIRIDFADNSSAHFVAGLPCQGISLDIDQLITALLSANPDAVTICMHDGNGDGLLDARDIQSIVESLLEE